MGHTRRTQQGSPHLQQGRAHLHEQPALQPPFWWISENKFHFSASRRRRADTASAAGPSQAGRGLRGFPTSSGKGGTIPLPGVGHEPAVLCLEELLLEEVLLV